jgi:hypothetical protein
MELACKMSEKRRRIRSKIIVESSTFGSILIARVYQSETEKYLVSTCSL